MRHLLVTRLVLLLVAMSLVAVWLFTRLTGPDAEPAPVALAVTSAAAPPDVARLFEQRCGSCHDTADLVADLAAAPARDARAGEWKLFVADHVDTSAAEAAALVDYLAARAEADAQVR